MPAPQDRPWTKGPWSIADDRLLIYVGPYPSRRVKKIADVSVSIAWRSSAEAGANARLIVAAPDLFEMLATALDALKALGHTLPLGEAALSKALGVRII